MSGMNTIHDLEPTVMSGVLERRVMLDRWEGIVKVVQQPLPLLVLGRQAKALGVVLQPAPVHK